MKIRIIKELPRFNIGDEIEIEQDSYGEKCIAGRFDDYGSSRNNYVYYLDEIEDYYEKVVEMPKEGELFWFVTEEGNISSLSFDDTFHQRGIIDFQDFRKTKEEAEAFRDEILKIKEKK